MRLSRRELGLGAAAVLAAGAARAQGPALDRQLTAFLDQAFEAELARDPERLTQLGRKTANNRLTDRSDAAQLQALEARRRSVAEMRRRFDPARLGEDARTSFEMWTLGLARMEDAWRWRGHRYVFDRDGPHTRLPNFMINTHAVDTPADLAAYVERVAAIGPTIDGELDRARRAAEAGVRMPRFAYEQSLGDVKRVASGAPFGGGADSALFADVKAKAAALRKAGRISQAEADRQVKAAAAAMTGRMKPAYDRLAAWLAADAANASAEPRGAGSLPDGAAFYAAQLRLPTTTEMTAEEIHQLGLSEVKRIRGEMEALKAKIGFAGTLEAFFEFLRSDPRFYVPNTDEGRARYLKAAEAHLAEMRAALPRYFARLPKSELVVKRVEAFREEPGGAAHYASGAPDGSRPGIYYVHLADTAATPIYEIEGTSYHEGWPGHHMQIMLAQEMTGQPLFRTQAGFAAYAEGWGLYVELLAKEAGFYRDPYSDFGRLGREIWRAIRLVVDTGIHAKGWSEAQATEFYAANSPQPIGKIRSEIRRYFVNPGQATAYKVGMVRILALREEAKAKLGPRFDLKGFHEAVLGAGSLPLSVLEARVRRWIAAQAA
jgi:uncharacterized protein (DUF885 family)